MIKSKLIKKIGYNVLNTICPNGINVAMKNFSLKLPVDYFRLFPKNYEDENFQFIDRSLKPGHTVLDIGAHIGLTAVLFGQKVTPNGRVFSFEPTPVSYGVLKETIRINKLEQVITPVNSPVTDKSGTVNFYISNTAVDVANSLVAWEKGKELHGIQLNATCVDDFVKSQKITKVDFMKIDAEGVEYKVLNGAKETLTTHKPLVILALHPTAVATNGDSLKDIYSFLKEIGYKIFLDQKEINEDSFCRQTGLFDVHLSFTNL